MTKIVSITLISSLLISPRGLPTIPGVAIKIMSKGRLSKPVALKISATILRKRLRTTLLFETLAGTDIARRQ